MPHPVLAAQLAEARRAEAEAAAAGYRLARTAKLSTKSQSRLARSSSRACAVNLDATDPARTPLRFRIWLPQPRLTHPPSPRR